MSDIKVINENLQQDVRRSTYPPHLNIHWMIMNKKPGVYELVRGKKTIFVYSEEEKIYVSWHTTGKKPLILTLQEFINLRGARDIIRDMFESNEVRFKRFIGDFIYVGSDSTCISTTDRYVMRKVVDIRVFNESTYQPTEIGIIMQKAEWEKINWFEINQYITLLQGNRHAILRACSKIMGNHVAKKMQSFCYECRNNLEDDLHECMWNSESQYIKYQDIIKYLSGEVISQVTDEEIIAMIFDIAKPHQYHFIISFIRNNPVVIGRFAQCTIEG